MDQFLNIAFFGTLAGLATVAGMAVLLYREQFARRNSILLVSFAAGVLMATAFLHLIPESMELSDAALIWVLAGFLAFYVLEHLILVHAPHDEEHEKIRPIGAIASLGLGFHSLIDGIAIGAGFEVSSSVGLVTTLAVILHEFPEGISTLSVLFHAGMERSKAIWYTFIVAIATPIGAIASYFLLSNIGEGILGALLAIAAGSFLYIAASDLVPETHHRHDPSNAVVLLFGVACIYLAKSAIGG
ncbi:MAG: ZIP family metal transporter [Candidatus Micrarchaeota archaeon]